MNSPTRSRSSATVRGPASFARAAVRLDDAAAKLSAAAEAMSVAAEIFSSIAPAFKLPPVAAVVEQPTQTAVSDQDIPAGYITEEECTNPGDSDYWISDQEERAYADSKVDYTNQSSQHTPNLIPPAPDTTANLQHNINSSTPTIAPGTEPTELYRILVDREGDVLPTVCSVMRCYERVVCYMACGLNVIAIYKDLVESVTGTITYTVTKSSPSHTNSVASRFFKHENAILLLPETVSLNSYFSTATDLCVIHVGWPSDEARYKKQIDVHRAQTNILVAFSEDSTLYPFGSNILLEATPWKPIKPSNELRLLFNQKLSDISAEKRKNIYMDWISCHGQCGSRYVESWDATNLFHRASLYILDVLRYKNAEPASYRVDFQVSLPLVTPGSVPHSKLEPAVGDGAPHTRPEPKNGTFSISKDEILTRGAASLNETDGSRRSDSIPPPDFWEGSSGANKYEHSTPKLDTPEHLPGSTAGNRPSVNIPPALAFELLPGHSYIAIEEEFDAIPLICFLANAHGQLVCFLDDEPALIHYRSLLSDIVSHTIYYPETVEDPKAVEDAANDFTSQSPPAILLLSVNTKNLPWVLTNTFINCAVHWGFRPPLQQAVKHYDEMTCSSAYVIMTTAQRDKRLEKGPMEIESHPSSESFCSVGESSLLDPMRNSTKSVLLSKKKLVQQMYRARVIFWAKIPRRVVSAEQVAERANTYSARILLHGNIEDGNETHKPVGDRPPVSRSLVSSFDLQPAVELGLFNVK